MKSSKRPIRTLAEVAKSLGVKKLGIPIDFITTNGYYDMTFRGPKNYTLNDGKIGKNVSLREKDGSVSYAYFKSIATFSSRFKLTRRHGNNYGEYLASIILNQLDMPFCRVDIGTFPFKHPYKQDAIIPLEGSLSHYQLEQNENFVPLSVIAQIFRSSKKKQFSSLLGKSKQNPVSSLSSGHFTNIDIILAAMDSFLTRGNQPNKIPFIRAYIFRMIMFDLKFVNRDRHDENFGLKVNQDTGEIDFYGLFDNEQILGFQLSEAMAKEVAENDKKFNEYKKKEFTSYIGLPDKPVKVSSEALFKYMLEHYPEETIDAYNYVSRYKFEDLQEAVEECLPNISEGHKALAYRLFQDREKEMAQVLEEYYKEHGTKPESTLDEF